MSYKQFNANPKNKKVGDCVIRAFSLASGKTWEETLTDLFHISLEIKSVPSYKDTYIKYAEQLGFEKCKAEIKNHKRPTVKSFTKEHNSGIYILSVANHIVTVKDGKYWDIWDCGDKSVYMYWKVI